MDKRKRNVGGKTRHHEKSAEDFGEELLATPAGVEAGAEVPLRLHRRAVVAHLDVRLLAQLVIDTRRRRSCRQEEGEAGELAAD